MAYYLNLIVLLEWQMKNVMYYISYSSIIDSILNEKIKKSKKPIKEWQSPKKGCDVLDDEMVRFNLNSISLNGFKP